MFGIAFEKEINFIFIQPIKFHYCIFYKACRRNAKIRKSDTFLRFHNLLDYIVTMSSLSVTDIDDGKCDGDKFEILVTYIEKVTKSMILSPTPETVAIIKSQHDVVTNITAGCSRLFN